MRIIHTNDDGNQSPGLELLEAIAARLSDDVWVCAPLDEQSGAGHSLTLNMPVRLRQFGEKRFAVTGTPTDAVNLALRKLFADRRPDLVISGINGGENLADDITYSGTISAAMEGALAGIPAIARSPSMREAGHDLAAAEAWATRVLAPLIDAPKARRTLININFPALPAEAVKGIRVVRQGLHDYARGSLVEGVDPRGKSYFWFGLEDVDHTLDHGTDLEAIGEGYVSVTPLQVDLTDHAALGALAERYAS
jgi:5'-nucleotidase